MLNGSECTLLNFYIEELQRSVSFTRSVRAAVVVSGARQEIKLFARRTPSTIFSAGLLAVLQIVQIAA
jgi:hypothetical protein